MDPRHLPPNLLTWELITADNFDQHLPLIENAFRLKNETLSRALQAPQNLAEFKDELNKSLYAVINPLNTNIINVSVYDNEITEVANFMQQKRSELTTQLNTIFNYLKNKEAALITAQIAEIENARQQIIHPDGCFAGNHALTLDIFKRNIAIALQNAAQALYTQHEASRKVPANFNAIFIDISHINQHEEIIHHPHIIDRFADCDLNELQKLLSGILSDCSRHKELAIMHEIKSHLKALNHLPGNDIIHNKVLIELHNENLRFTHDMHTIEQRALTAAHDAKQILRHLDQSEESKIETFEEDKSVQENTNKLRAAILNAADEIENLKDNIARRLNGDVHRRSATPEPAHAITPPAKQSFWQRHPVFKKVCIGALIGLGIAAFAAIITGAIVLSGGAAAASITAFAGILTANFGIAGTIGLALLAALPIVSTCAAIGWLVGDVQALHHKELANTASTARIMQEMQHSESLPVNSVIAPQSHAVTTAHSHNEPVNVIVPSLQTEVTPPAELLHHSRSP